MITGDSELDLINCRLLKMNSGVEFMATSFVADFERCVAVLSSILEYVPRRMPAESTLVAGKVLDITMSHGRWFEVTFLKVIRDTNVWRRNVPI